MSDKKISYKSCVIKDVTDDHNLWKNTDPVRAHLTPYFKSSKGRRVYGLMSPDEAC